MRSGLAATILLAGSPVVQLPATPHAAVAAVERSRTVAPAAATRLSVSIAPGRTGTLLRFRASVKLTVKVTARGGAAVAGKQIRFTAPDRGASGYFHGAPVASRFVAVAKSDARGKASAIFTANAIAGTYLVVVGIPSSGVATTFAMTNIKAASATKVTARHARTAAMAALGSSSTSSVLFGPVLLPTGAGVVGEPGTSLAIVRPTWFLWSDDAPGAKYAHPTRFVTVPAAVSGPATVTPAALYPSIRWPGRPRAVPLRPPTATNALPPVRTSVMGAHLFLHDTTKDPNACAIVVYGADESMAEYDAQRMAQFFGDRVAAVYMPSPVPVDTTEPGSPFHVPPADINDLNNLVKQAQSNPNCKTLYVYISAHGTKTSQPSGFWLYSKTPDEEGTNQQTVNFTDLAGKLRPLAQKGVKLYVITDVCYSGGAVDAFKIAGVPVTLATSADTERPSLYNSDKWWATKSAFTDALLVCWKPGMTLQEAMACVLALPEDARARFGNPQSQEVKAGRFDETAPRVQICKTGDRVTVLVPRPAAIPPGARASLAVSTGDGKVASYVYADKEGAVHVANGLSYPNDEVDLNTDADALPLTFQAGAAGTTSYTLTWTNQLISSVQTGTIVVGTSVTASASHVSLKVGESATVTVMLGGLLALSPGPKNVSALAQASGVIAVAPHQWATAGDETTSDSRVLAPGQTQVTFTVSGTAPGTTVVNVTGVCPYGPAPGTCIAENSFTVTVTPADSGGSGGSGAQTLPEPRLLPIHASFDQSRFSTYYTETAIGDDLKYAWGVAIPIDPQCAGGFMPNTPLASQASWFHADVTEGGPCNHSGTAYDPNNGGHPGTIVVVVSNKDWSCTATYFGTLSGDGPTPPACTRVTSD
jgi:hypothetical protein